MGPITSQSALSSPTQRDYGGVSAAARTEKRRQQFLEAGLSLIGTTGMQALTVRGVIDTAQLAPRYFYESFENLDALALAVFDRVLQEMTQVGLAATAEIEMAVAERVRAGLGAVARLLTDDPRKGRVLLIESTASPVLAPLRHGATAMIARLLAEQVQGTITERPTDPATIDITARFLVGGFSETIAALLLEPDQHQLDAVIDQCTRLFLATEDLR